MEHQPFRIQQRFYSDLYSKQQIDIFYDLVELAHTIIFNENHIDPTTSVPLFIEPQVIQSRLNISNEIGTEQHRRQTEYLCVIRYKIDKNADEDDLPPLRLRIYLIHQSKSIHTQIDDPYMNFSVQYKYQTFIYDEQKTKDLFRIWLLIPRIHYTKRSLPHIYNRLVEDYNYRQNIKYSIFPEFVQAASTRVNQETSGLIKHKEDILRLIRQFSLQ